MLGKGENSGELSESAKKFNNNKAAAAAAAN
jgi:hypothetical protein